MLTSRETHSALLTSRETHSALLNSCTHIGCAGAHLALDGLAPKRYSGAAVFIYLAAIAVLCNRTFISVLVYIIFVQYFWTLLVRECTFIAVQYYWPFVVH